MYNINHCHKKENSYEKEVKGDLKGKKCGLEGSCWEK